MSPGAFKYIRDAVLDGHDNPNAALYITPVQPTSNLKTMLIESGLDEALAFNIHSKFITKHGLFFMESDPHTIWWLAGPVVDSQSHNILFILWIPHIYGDIPMSDIKFTNHVNDDLVLYRVNVHAAPNGRITIFDSVMSKPIKNTKCATSLYKILSNACYDLIKHSRVILVPCSDNTSVVFIPKRPMQINLTNVLIKLQEREWIVQPKYDGQRLIMVCSTNLNGASYKLYTRNGRILGPRKYERFDYFVEQLSARGYLPCVLEGEVMGRDGQTFEVALGHIRRHGLEGHRVNFFNIWWPLPAKQRPYLERYSLLRDIIALCDGSKYDFYIVPRLYLNTEAELHELRNNPTIEGIILRHFNELQMASLSKHFYKYKPAINAMAQMLRIYLGPRGNNILIEVKLNEVCGTATLAATEPQMILLRNYIPLMQKWLESAKNSMLIPIVYLGITDHHKFRFSPTVKCIDLLEVFSDYLQPWPELFDLYNKTLS